MRRKEQQREIAVNGLQPPFPISLCSWGQEGHTGLRNEGVKLSLGRNRRGVVLLLCLLPFKNRVRR